MKRLTSAILRKSRQNTSQTTRSTAWLISCQILPWQQQEARFPEFDAVAAVWWPLWSSVRSRHRRTGCSLSLDGHCHSRLVRPPAHVNTSVGSKLSVGELVGGLGGAADSALARLTGSRHRGGMDLARHSCMQASAAPGCPSFGLARPPGIGPSRATPEGQGARMQAMILRHSGGARPGLRSGLAGRQTVLKESARLTPARCTLRLVYSDSRQRCSVAGPAN